MQQIRQNLFSKVSIAAAFCLMALVFVGVIQRNDPSEKMAQVTISIEEPLASNDGEEVLSSDLAYLYGDVVDDQSFGTDIEEYFL